MPCHRESRRCYTATSYKHPTQPCCRKGIMETLEFTGNLLADHGIAWWADYGTLLGVVRHKDLIPHDKDTDIGILGQDFPKLLTLREEAEAAGFGWGHSQLKGGLFQGGNRVKIRWSRINHSNCDIFPWYLEEDGLFHRKAYIGIDQYKGRAFPKDWLFPLREGRFGDLIIPIPNKAEELVKFRYGKDWRTPIQLNNDRKHRGDYAKDK